MSKRKDFEEALVDHLIAMMSWVAKKRGGVHEMLNDFFLAVDHPEFTSRRLNEILKKKGITDKELSSDWVDVEIYYVILTAEFKPEWTYWVQIGEDDEIQNAWHIEGILIRIHADDKSYRVVDCVINDINKERVDPEANDPLWDYFITLVNGETYLKTMEFSKQSQL